MSETDVAVLSTEPAMAEPVNTTVEAAAVNTTVEAAAVKPTVEAVAVKPAVEVVAVKPAVEAAAAKPTVEEPANLQITTEQVNVVVEGITSLLRGRKMSQALLIRVVANCMIITAKMKLQNHVKKEVVLLALEKFIREKSGLPQDEVDLLMTLVDVLVADAIDTLADVKKGTINLSSKNCCSIM